MRKRCVSSVLVRVSVHESCTAVSVLGGSKFLPGGSFLILFWHERRECLGHLDEVGPGLPIQPLCIKGEVGCIFPDCLVRQQLAVILCLPAFLVSLPWGMGCVFLPIPGTISVMVSSLVSSLEYVMQKSHHCFMSQGLKSLESLHPPRPLECWR